MISYYDAKKKWLKNSCGHTLKRLLQTNELSCIVHSQRKVDNKIITRKIRNESIPFSNRIQGDICDPIHPPCGSFHGFD